MTDKWFAVLAASVGMGTLLWFFGYVLSISYYLSFEHWNPLGWAPPWRGINGAIWFIATAIFIGAATND